MKSFEKFISEISDKTLSSYYHKAGASADREFDKGNYRKAQKRAKGQGQALSRHDRTKGNQNYGKKSNTGYVPKHKDLNAPNI